MSAARVLVLAGLDPSGRAGLLADGEAIRAAGALPVLCATAVAAQSGQRLLRIDPLPVATLEAQVAAALEDGPVGAVKLGMLGTREILDAVAALLEGPLAQVPVVIDPVLESSRGGALYCGAPQDYLRLLARAQLLTPNLVEAERLCGLACRDEASMLEAARALLALGAKAVLLKGGHLDGAPADLLCTPQRSQWLRRERLVAQKRGTGCRLASAIAARLCLGQSLPQAVERGVEQVARYLAS